MFGAGAMGASLAGLLDNMMIGVICLDWRGTIVQVTTRAREILRHGDGLVDRRSFLRARLAADDVQLGRLLAHALPRSRRPRTSGSMAVARSPELTRYALHMVPVDVGGAGFGFGHVAALAVVVDPAAKPRVDTERVAAVLGLTAAECGVAAAVARGATPKGPRCAASRRLRTERKAPFARSPPGRCFAQHRYIAASGYGLSDATELACRSSVLLHNVLVPSPLHKWFLPLACGGVR